MAPYVYLFITLVTLLCAALLLRAYRRVRQPLLLWSGLCFTGLTISNALLFVDLVILRDTISLYLWRLGTATGSMLLLLYGLIWESE